MNRAILLPLFLALAACGSNTGVHGDATSEPDIEVGDPVALSGITFVTRNDSSSTVYAPLNPLIHDELPMERNLGAGWEHMTFFRPLEDLECPMRPDECICPTHPEPWQLRQIVPGDEYIVGWGPPTPSTTCYVFDHDFCADCRCYRTSEIYPGAYAVTRCVFTDYRCTESEPCGPESVGYFRPAEGAGEEICLREEFTVPGAPSSVNLVVE
jgi:hypothetical protein